jgi:hypothetical protein
MKIYFLYIWLIVFNILNFKDEYPLLTIWCVIIFIIIIPNTYKLTYYLFNTYYNINGFILLVIFLQSI